MVCTLTVHTDIPKLRAHFRDGYIYIYIYTYIHIIYFRSQDDVVITATGLRVGILKNSGSIPDRIYKCFYIPKCPNRLWASSTPYSMDTGQRGMQQTTYLY